MSSEHEMDQLRNKVEEHLRLAKADPTDDDVDMSPHLDFWQTVATPFGTTILIGHARGHPVVDGPWIHTSPLLRISRSAGWARTFSRFYQLGKPLVDADPDAGEAILISASARGYRAVPPIALGDAMQRNREFILERPWIFG